MTGAVLWRGIFVPFVVLMLTGIGASRGPLFLLAAFHASSVLNGMDVTVYSSGFQKG